MYQKYLLAVSLPIPGKSTAVPWTVTLRSVLLARLKAAMNLALMGWQSPPTAAQALRRKPVAVPLNPRIWKRAVVSRTMSVQSVFLGRLTAVKVAITLVATFKMLRDTDHVTVSCVDRAAVIECIAECGDKGQEPASPGSMESDTGLFSARCDSPFPESEGARQSAGTGRSRACDMHLQSARDRYSTVEGVIKCICRILKAKNLDSCCGPQKKCRTTPSPDKATESQEKKLAYNQPRKEPSCCVKPPCIDDDIMATKSPCTTTTRIGETEHAIRIQQPDYNDTHADRIPDVEKGEPHLEHVVLSVNGMTCTGCEIGLSRALESLPDIRNLKTSVLLSRAEFDLDVNRMLADQVIAYIGRVTKFTCEEVTSKGRTIEVISPRSPKLSIQQVRMPGVMGMKSVTDEITQIEYDPTLLGVRTLLDSAFAVALPLAPAKPSKSVKAGSKQVRKEGLITLISCLLTIPVLVFAWAPLPEHPVIYESVSLALATIIQVGIAGQFYPVAFKSLVFSGLIEVDLLIVLSTTTAYVFSVIAFAYEMKGEPLMTGSFFQASTLIVSLIMLGRFISAWARQRAAESISLRTLQTPTAILLDDESETEEEIDARLLQYGDVFKVNPDSRIVTDGTVIRGMSEVDESMVTGESQPVVKEPGSTIVAGSMNGSGVLRVRLSRLPGDNTISAIADMVDEARMSKPNTQQIADRVAGYFVPVIVCVTIITFAGWMGYDVGERGYSASEAAQNAVTYAIAVLIISCPCAIGLCVPMVVVIAGGVAAKHGIIFKTGQTVEIARKTNRVVFDKTGTLTKGVLSVMAEAYLEGEEQSIKPLILGLIGDIKHPVSAAVARHLKDQGVHHVQVDEIRSQVGKGVQGVSGGIKIAAGNCRWLGFQNNRTVQHFASRGLTVFCVVIDTRPRAVFGLEDSIRPDSHAVISELQKRNIAISIVSGDDDGPVRRIASLLNIPPSQVRSRCSPKDKVEYLQDVMKDKQAVVMFCGDGTNDAPALAQANIGVHVNEGSEIAQSAADAVLMRPSLGGIVCLMDLSRAAVRRIILNFCWSFIYNLFAVLLAAGLFVKWRIPPQYAAIGEIISVLPVIGIALLLRYIKLESPV